MTVSRPRSRSLDDQSPANATIMHSCAVAISPETPESREANPMKQNGPSGSLTQAPIRSGERRPRQKSPSKQFRNAALRRQMLLEAAAAVFAERGFDAATTKEIGARAG